MLLPKRPNVGGMLPMGTGSGCWLVCMHVARAYACTHACMRARARARVRVRVCVRVYYRRGVNVFIGILHFPLIVAVYILPHCLWSCRQVVRLDCWCEGGRCYCRPRIRRAGRGRPSKPYAHPITVARQGEPHASPGATWDCNVQRIAAPMHNTPMNVRIALPAHRQIR